MNLGNRFGNMESRIGFGGNGSTYSMGRPRIAYGYSQPIYKSGRIISREVAVGPYSYRRPRVEYSVNGPQASLGVQGPKAALGVDNPMFAARTTAGRLSTRGAHVANSFKRPEIETFRPQFRFEAPQLSFKGGRAHTQGPDMSYAGPVIKQEFRAPEQHLDAPTFQKELAGPQGHFDVQKPVEQNSVKGPTTQYAFHAPEAHLNPTIRRYGYEAPQISHKKIEYVHEPVHYKAPEKKMHAW